MKTTVIILGIIIVVLFGILIFVKPAQGPTIPAQPAVSVSSDGHLSLALPHMNDAVGSPAAIEGTVTGGGWFNEGSFPVKVLDADGTVLGQGTAQALSNWMSTGTVPFSASIPFTAPHSATGTILLLKDNPSGAPQNAASLGVPIRFQQ